MQQELYSLGFYTRTGPTCLHSPKSLDARMPPTEPPTDSISPPEMRPHTFQMYTLFDYHLASHWNDHFGDSQRAPHVPLVSYHTWGSQ